MSEIIKHAYNLGFEEGFFLGVLVSAAVMLAYRLSRPRAALEGKDD